MGIFTSKKIDTCLGTSGVMYSPCRIGTMPDLWLFESWHKLENIKVFVSKGLHGAKLDLGPFFLLARFEQF